MSADKKATTAPVAWPREADPLTQALQRLNSIPYNITKSECIEVLRHLRADLSAPPAAARVPLTPAQQHADELLKALQLAKNSLVAFKFMPGANNAWEDHDEDNLKAVDAAIEAAGQEGGAS